ncbi:serine protease [Rhodopirellula sp. MGV]|uniref:S1 family peptidase n=1 Tax=Rhodopirellula sp. MGV TaxID=2023130 RepID=UPI000B97BD26|nr:serine protease [Rhodopirellula sp. MGV]OYP34091.1 hypothetical protein CGZ80_16320 [Rhodopirellula sp. MGV]PNY35604.1 serine protease [Rhodopirellula baltica]
MKILVTLFCGLLILGQVGYILMANLDGSIDRSRLPTWAGGMDAKSKPASVGLAVSGDDSDQDGPLVADGTSDLGDASQDSSIGAESSEYLGSEPVSSEPASSELLSHGKSPLSTEAIREIATHASIRLIDKGGESMGSGIVIANREDGTLDFLTAAHVIEGIEGWLVEVTTEASAKERFAIESKVDVLESDIDKDLAYVRVHCDAPVSAEPVELADVVDDKLKHLQAAWTIDNQVAGLTSVARVPDVELKLIKRMADSPAQYCWRVAHASELGVSGSALLNRDGCLVGIASGNGDGAAYYCGPIDIRNMVSRFR